MSPAATRPSNDAELVELGRHRGADRSRWLEAGLDRAAHSSGLTSVVLPAAPAEPSLLLAAAPAFGAGSAVTLWWPPRGEAFVGLGAAATVRGEGEARWTQIRDGAERLCARVEQRVVAGEVVSSSPHAGLLRPRFLGGLAFAPGAAAAPPWQELGDAWFALPRWSYVVDNGTAYLSLLIDREGAGERAKVRAELAAIDRALASARPAPPRAQVAELCEDGDAWMECVTAARDFINSGAADKIVAARCQTLRLAEPVRTADVFAALADRHPDCTRVLMAPAHTVWMAATPERLVQKSGLRVACDALAGSVPRRGREEEEKAALLASDKERREHELVVTAIAAALRGLDLGVEHAATPEVRTLRHVHHLATPVVGKLSRELHVLDIAAALHPTPAVGGTPTETALRWLTAHEDQPRGWYASPIGWFDRHGDGELAVGIRSGLFDEDRVHLWAGAGIVGASEPAREQAERRAKLRALRGALGLDE